MTIPDTAASYDAGALAAEAVRLDIRAHAAESVTAALDHVIETTPVPARVIICGSLYLAGHVLERNG